MAKILPFETENISLGKAIAIVICGLNDPEYSLQQKVIAIEKVANMATHNSIKKEELVSALRWLFEHYDFEVDKP